MLIFSKVSAVSPNDHLDQLNEMDVEKFLQDCLLSNIQVFETETTPYGPLDDMDACDDPMFNTYVLVPLTPVQMLKQAVTPDSMAQFVSSLPVFKHISDDLLRDVYEWYMEEEETIDLTQDDDEEIIDLTQDEEDLE